MLVLSRKLNQSIVINGNILVTVLSVKAGNVKLGITAPDDVRIVRSELIVQAKPLRFSKSGAGTSRKLYAMSEL